MRKLCKEKGIHVSAWGPLCEGSLAIRTAKSDDHTTKKITSTKSQENLYLYIQKDEKKCLD